MGLRCSLVLGLCSGTNKRVALAFVPLRVTTGQGGEKYSLCRGWFSETSKAVSL